LLCNNEITLPLTPAPFPGKLGSLGTFELT